MITLIIFGVIQLRKDNMAIKLRKGGGCWVRVPPRSPCG